MASEIQPPGPVARRPRRWRFLIVVVGVGFAVAVERYRLHHGRWPESIAAISPGLLPAVIPDLCDGQPLRFKHTAEGLVIYSVGPDLTDNGGNIAKDAGQPPDGTDIGFRLWDVINRGGSPKH